MRSKLFLLVLGIMCFVAIAKGEVILDAAGSKLKLPDMGFKEGFELCFNGQARCLILTSIKWVKHEYKEIEIIHGQRVAERFLLKTDYDRVAPQLVAFLKKNPGQNSKQSSPCLETFVLTHKKSHQNPETITGCTNWLSKSEKDAILQL